MPVTVSLSGTMSSGSGLKAEVTPTSALDLNRNTMTAALLPRVTQTGPLCLFSRPVNGFRGNKV